jgi:predicted dehydrogenase
MRVSSGHEVGGVTEGELVSGGHGDGERTIRAAIVGSGNIAKAHIFALGKMGGRAEVVAAVDVDGARAEAFRAEHRIPRAYSNTAQMLEEEAPDLVHICTPPQSHCALSVLCMEAGAWVLCEKPLCASLEEMDAIEAAERATGQYCSSVYQWRFGSGARHLKALISSGELGRPLAGLCQTTWYRDAAYYSVPWRGKWETELGGATMSQGIHAMDLFLWLLGDWREVRAMVGTLDREIEVEDVSMATVLLENGAMGSIVNSVISPRQRTHLRFDFQEATVEVDSLYRYSNADWSYSIPDGASTGDSLARWREIPEETLSMHAGQVSDLLDCMDQGRRPSTSGSGARRTLEFITSLYKAAMTGEPVLRGSIGQGDPFYSRMNGAPLEGTRG